MKFTAELGFIKRLFWWGEETDTLEKGLLPDRKYWLRFSVWSCQSHSNAVYRLTVLNTNVIHNCRDTLSEPSNTDLCNFSGHGVTQQETQTLKFTYRDNKPPNFDLEQFSQFLSGTGQRVQKAEKAHLNVVWMIWSKDRLERWRGRTDQSERCLRCPSHGYTPGSMALEESSYLWV